MPFVKVYIHFVCNNNGLYSIPSIGIASIELGFSPFSEIKIEGHWL
jgi:hypothetical protein